MVTQDEIIGRWRTISGKVKSRYGDVTDDELTQVEGNLDQLIGLVQRKTGEGRAAVEAFLNDVYNETDVDRDGGGFSRASAGMENIKDGYENVADHLRAGYKSSSTAIASRPFESTLAALCVGLIAGMAVGLSIGGYRKPEPSFYDRMHW